MATHLRNLLATIAAATAVGCCAGPEYTTAPVCPPQQPMAAGQPAAVQPAPPAHSNPVFVPVADQHCAWEQVVDVLDDYFRIEREEPVRMIGNDMTTGVITTVPEVSPTIFEPWRSDTVDEQQRIENTLQTMRRRAVVRVTPVQGGQSVEVQVFKELEDNKRPDQTTAGSATFRYDDTLTRVVDPIGDKPSTLGWIAQGRDTILEQYIINDLLSRTGQTPQPGPVVMRGQSADRTK